MARPSRDQTDSGDEDQDRPPVASEKYGGRRCKVDGCGIDLKHDKTFFRRARCCQEHARELTVHLGGEAKRLCQQCSGFHPLADFDGTKRSCRTRLESHKVRQRELNSRRLAQAAALQQAVKGSAAASLAVPAAPGVQLADASGGALSGASHLGQQLLGIAAAGVPAAWAPPQQPAATQQQAPALQFLPPPANQQAPDLQQLLATQQASALQPPMASALQQLAAAQQQALALQPPLQQQPQPPPLPQQRCGDAAAMEEAPSIFADMLLDDLPLDVQPARQAQPSWKQPPVDVHMLSNFWDGPVPQGSMPYSLPGSGGGSEPRVFKGQSIWEMQLGRPVALPEGCYRAGGSVRSMSAGEGLGSGFGGSFKSADREPRCQSDCEDDGLRRRWLPFQSALEAPLKQHAADKVPAYNSLQTRSVQRESLDSYDLPSRQRFLTAKRASLEVIRTASAFEGGGFGQQGFGRPAALQRCVPEGQKSLGSGWESRGSRASSPTRLTPLPSAFELRLPSLQRCSALLPRSVKRRSLSVLPDGAPTDVAPHDQARAFMEQAPEPLYLAHQLLKGSGRRHRDLPEFSYGRINSSGGGGGGGFSRKMLDEFDILAPLRGCGADGDFDALDAAAFEEGAASDEISARLRRLGRMPKCPAASYGSLLQRPPAMGRRIRRRSCDEGAMHRGFLHPAA